jgi:Tfp pilus assembly protein PilV
MKGAGFTLIEVVLILVIVGIAILPLSLLFANASIRSGEARDATVAAQLAQAKMEEIAADKSSPADAVSEANYPPENPVVAFPRYRRSVLVSADSTFDGVRFRAVSVTVSTSSIPPVTLTTWFTGH